MDRARQALYCADFADFRVRKVNLTNGLISNYAGTFPPGFSGDGGPATNASFGVVHSVAADASGNVFAVDYSGTDLGEPPIIRRIDALTGIITTVVGGGTNVTGTRVATNQLLRWMRAVAVNPAGTRLYFSGSTNLDIYAHRVFQVDLTTGQLAIVAGTGEAGFSSDGGPALQARFSDIYGLAVAPGGGLVVADSGNQRLRYLVPDSINLVGDSQQTDFALPWVSALAGDFTVVNNPNLTNVSAGALTNVAGSVEVSGNDAASVIDLDSLNSAGSDVTIIDNDGATVINLGELGSIGGAIDVSDNAAAGYYRVRLGP